MNSVPKSPFPFAIWPDNDLQKSRKPTPASRVGSYVVDGTRRYRDDPPTRFESTSPLTPRLVTKETHTADGHPFDEEDHLLDMEHESDQAEHAQSLPREERERRYGDARYTARTRSPVEAKDDLPRQSSMRRTKKAYDPTRHASQEDAERAVKEGHDKWVASGGADPRPKKPKADKPAKPDWKVQGRQRILQSPRSEPRQDNSSASLRRRNSPDAMKKGIADPRPKKPKADKTAKPDWKVQGRQRILQSPRSEPRQDNSSASLRRRNSPDAMEKGNRSMRRGTMRKSVPMGYSFDNPMPIPFHDDGLPNWDGVPHGCFTSLPMDNGPLKGKVVVLHRLQNGMYIISPDGKLNNPQNRDKDKGKLRKERPEVATDDNYGTEMTEKSLRRMRKGFSEKLRDEFLILAGYKPQQLRKADERRPLNPRAAEMIRWASDGSHRLEPLPSDDPETARRNHNEAVVGNHRLAGGTIETLDRSKLKELPKSKPSKPESAVKRPAFSRPKLTADERLMMQREAEGFRAEMDAGKHRVRMEAEKRGVVKKSETRETKPTFETLTPESIAKMDRQIKRDNAIREEYKIKGVQARASDAKRAEEASAREAKIKAAQNAYMEKLKADRHLVKKAASRPGKEPWTNRQGRPTLRGQSRRVRGPSGYVDTGIKNNGLPGPELSYAEQDAKTLKGDYIRDRREKKKADTIQPYVEAMGYNPNDVYKHMEGSHHVERVELERQHADVPTATVQPKRDALAIKHQNIKRELIARIRKDHAKAVGQEPMPKEMRPIAGMTRLHPEHFKSGHDFFSRPTDVPWDVPRNVPKAYIPDSDKRAE